MNSSHYTDTGLGEAKAGVSTATIRSWVQNLKAQEDGRAPDRHKINGNMAWRERAGKTDTPIYQLYESFGKSSRKMLAYLKKTVPEEFGIEPQPSTTSVPSTNGGGGTIFGMKKKTAYIAGGGLLGVGALLFIIGRN